MSLAISASSHSSAFVLTTPGLVALRFLVSFEGAAGFIVVGKSSFGAEVPDFILLVLCNCLSGKVGEFLIDGAGRMVSKNGVRLIEGAGRMAFSGIFSFVEELIGTLPPALKTDHLIRV